MPGRWRPYEYYVRKWRADVKDVQVVSPKPGTAAVHAVLKNGNLLNKTEREGLAAYINGEEMRPLCDRVVCPADTDCLE